MLSPPKLHSSIFHCIWISSWLFLFAERLWKQLNGTSCCTSSRCHGKNYLHCSRWSLLFEGLWILIKLQAYIHLVQCSCFNSKNCCDVSEACLENGELCHQLCRLLELVPVPWVQEKDQFSIFPVFLILVKEGKTDINSFSWT